MPTQSDLTRGCHKWQVCAAMGRGSKCPVRDPRPQILGLRRSSPKGDWPLKSRHEASLASVRVWIGENLIGDVEARALGDVSQQPGVQQQPWPGEGDLQLQLQHPPPRSPTPSLGEPRLFFVSFPCRRHPPLFILHHHNSIQSEPPAHLSSFLSTLFQSTHTRLR